MSLHQAGGVLITQVEPDSFAADIGLHEGRRAGVDQLAGGKHTGRRGSHPRHVEARRSSSLPRDDARRPSGRMDLCIPRGDHAEQRTVTSSPADNSRPGALPPAVLFVTLVFQYEEIAGLGFSPFHCDVGLERHARRQEGAGKEGKRLRLGSA